MFISFYQIKAQAFRCSSISYNVSFICLSCP